MKNKKKAISKTVATILMVLLMVLTVSMPAGASTSTVTGTERIGVLVVAHGSTSEWCDSIRSAVADANLDGYPVEIGFLENVDNETIPDAVERLDEQGVTRIVAVPMFISSSSGHISEIEYILGLTDDAPEEGLVQADTDAEIIFTDAMNDHSFIAEVIADRAAKLIADADNETVVIVFHGTTDEHLEGWIKSSSSLADKTKLILRHSMGITVEDVRYCFINVNGDATDYKIGNVVSDVSHTSHPVVIPAFVGEGYYTNTKIPSLLSGMDYSYPEKGERSLIPHSRIGDWLEATVAKEVSCPVISIYDGDEIVEISQEDLEEGCLCSACAYMSSLYAFSYGDVWDGIPRRGDLSIISAHPSDGHEEVFLHMILDNLGEDYTVSIPEGTDMKHIVPQNYNYTFIQKSSGDYINIRVKEEVFPESMFELRTKAQLGAASPEQKKAFQLLKSIVLERMLYSPSEELFDATVVLSGGSSDPSQPPAEQIPEFPTIILPVAAVIGLALIFQRKRA
jgi:sirohydrochlorin ferrochelatase